MNQVDLFIEGVKALAGIIQYEQADGITLLCKQVGEIHDRSFNTTRQVES